METQKEKVLRILKERGDAGLSAHELTYQHGITRAAAVVFDLRKEGYPIETKQDFGQQAVYYLRAGKKVEPTPPEVDGQEELFAAEELPAISWDELGQKQGWRE